jgi:hypothetical protein
MTPTDPSLVPPSADAVAMPTRAERTEQIYRMQRAALAHDDARVGVLDAQNADLHLMALELIDVARNALRAGDPSLCKTGPAMHQPGRTEHALEPRDRVVAPAAQAGPARAKRTTAILIPTPLWVPPAQTPSTVL